MRLFIYVNEHQYSKHITIHCEQTKPCPHLMQQIIKKDISENIVKIEDISLQQNKKVLKLKKDQENDTYWLLLHIPNNECNNINLNQIKRIPEIENILNRIEEISIRFCNRCCNI